MKNVSALGKPSIFFSFICLFLLVFILFDFYQVTTHGRTIMLRGADYIYYDSDFLSMSNVLFFMSVGLKLLMFPIAFYYLLYCFKMCVLSKK